MKFGFKKIACVLASAVMLTSTVGFAVAANYPEPFTSGGAVIYGINAAQTDLVAAIDVYDDLKSGSTTAEETTSITGEAIELFSGGTKLYVNDSLNTVKNVLTKANLPTVLKDGSFSGIVDASITQTIEIGFNPRFQFKKQPTSSDDPGYGLTTSTTLANYIYNASATFSKAVDFTNASSEGEEIVLFGQTFTVAAATDATDLVLLQSATKVSLDSDNPTTEVTIAGATYTIELVSASDTAATIKVTDSDGNSNTREVNEAASKKIGGVTIAVTNADETNLKLSASVVVGSEKVTITSGSALTKGEDDTVIDGTLATLTGGTTATTKLVISIAAPDSDNDAIKSGDVMIDPVFGTFKFDFAGWNIEEDSSKRESITVANSGDDKMEVSFTDHRGNEATIPFAKNSSTTKIELMRDDDFRNITVLEKQAIKYQEYAVVGNEDEGYLLRLSSVKNATTGTNNDYVKFTDVFSGDTLETVWTSDGVGTMSVGGKSYAVSLAGNSNTATEDYVVRLNYPDSSGNYVVAYPTIQTSKGAKLAFYEALILNLSNWDGSDNSVTYVRFPDGDGYTDVQFEGHEGTGVHGTGTWNITHSAGTETLETNNTASSVDVAIGQLTYNITGYGHNATKIMLQTVGGVNIDDAALVVFEEKDDNNVYEALIVRLEAGATGDDGIGVEDVERTWSTDNTAWEATMASDSKKTKDADLWGTLTTTDSSDSDQKTAIISYPDDQLYALIYAAEETATITPGTNGGATGTVTITTDREVTSVEDKNLFVVGGSCINEVALKIVDAEATAPICEADFTTKTGVGVGQYIIKTVVSPYNEDKIAMLVAGFEAAETISAVNKAMEGVSTDVGEKIYPEASTE